MFTNPMLRPSFVGLLLLALCGLWGCGAKTMRDVPASSPVTAPADQATVVFLRPSGFGFAVNFTILGRGGEWLGDAVADSHFAVTLAPGEYTFVGWAENTAALKASLAAGRIYYVEVTPVTGFLSARIKLEGLSPRHKDWPNLSTWMAETTRLEPLPAARDGFAQRRNEVEERIHAANEAWNEYSEMEKAVRSLRPEDGQLAKGQPERRPEARRAPPPPPVVVAPPVASSAPPPAAVPPPAVTPPPVVVPAPAAGCRSDVDCPADQICQEGRCALPAPAKSCKADRDCPGEELCERGVCVAPSHAPARKCGKDMDCAGDMVCVDSVCKPSQ